MLLIQLLSCLVFADDNNAGLIETQYDGAQYHSDRGRIGMMNPLITHAVAQD